MIRSILRGVHRVNAVVSRGIQSSPAATPYDRKYAVKLHRKAQEKGLDLEELRSQARVEARSKQRQETASLVASFKKVHTESSPNETRFDSPESARPTNVRKDSSPVKPLSSILNLSKLLATPHTASQISALWAAYHASRSKGTGRGYICGSLSLESYNAMMCTAKKYPVFVVPVPRESNPDKSAGEGVGSAHEFFFLQWDFHPAPPAPSAADPDPSEPVRPAPSCHLPNSSTVLFTPLQEYKLRTSFATPYLVLTFYTDLSQSHEIVLLRGEITPSSTAAVQSGNDVPERFLLSQVDAQLLTIGLQRFYLWGEGRKEESTAEILLKQFHDEPERFNWQDLLEFSDVVR